MNESKILHAVATALAAQGLHGSSIVIATKGMLDALRGPKVEREPWVEFRLWCSRESCSPCLQHLCPRWNYSAAKSGGAACRG